MEVRRLAPCEALVALLGAVLMVGGILGCVWFVPCYIGDFLPNAGIGLLMLASLALAGMGLAVYWAASEIQAKRLDREEG